MTAITGIRRLGFAVAALILIVFGVLAAISFFLPADHVRDAVRAEIRAVTGLEPVLRGETSVSLFPSGRVSFSDVTLGEGKSGEAPLTADRLTAHLRFFPLLTGRIEISDVWLENPHIVISVAPDGGSNWSPMMEAITRSFGPKTGGGGQPISFSEIRIGGGSILIRDEMRNVNEELSGVEMSLAWPAISKSFAATGRFTWRNEPVDASISIADFSTALHGDKSGLKVRLNGAPVKITFDGTMSVRPTLKMEGNLTADAPSLKRALTWTKQKPLPGGGFGRFSLKAQMNVVGSTVALSGANLELDGNTAEGVLTFATDGRQSWQGTLAADALDLTPYISTVRLLTSNKREWNGIPIELEGLDGIDLDLRLSAAKITVGSAAFGRTAIATNLRSGKLTITIGESRAFGGVIRGSIGLAKAGESAELKTQMQFSEVDLETCIGELFGVKRLEGKGHLAIAAEANGATVLDLVRTLTGNATLTGRRGALTGLDVEQLLRRLERRPLSGGNEFRNGRTPFDRISIAVKIAQGAATVEDFNIEGPAMRVTLDGSASVLARDFDLKGVASLLGSTSSDGRAAFDLPFVVQGPWEDPIILPDPQILIRRSGAAAPLLKKYIDNGSLGDAAKKAFDRARGIGVTTPDPAAKPATP